MRKKKKVELLFSEKLRRIMRAIHSKSVYVITLFRADMRDSFLNWFFFIIKSKNSLKVPESIRIPSVFILPIRNNCKKSRKTQLAHHICFQQATTDGSIIKILAKWRKVKISSRTQVLIFYLFIFITYISRSIKYSHILCAKWKNWQ